MAKKDEGAFFPEESDIDSLIGVLKEIELNTRPRTQGAIPTYPIYEDFTKYLGNLDLIVPMGFILLHNDLTDLIELYKKGCGTSDVVATVGSSLVGIITATGASEVIKSLLKDMTLTDVVDEFVRLGNWILGDGSEGSGALDKIGSAVTTFFSDILPAVGGGFTDTLANTVETIALLAVSVTDIFTDEDLKEQRKELVGNYINFFFAQQYRNLGYKVTIDETTGEIKSFSEDDAKTWEELFAKPENLADFGIDLWKDFKTATVGAWTDYFKENALDVAITVKSAIDIFTDDSIGDINRNFVSAYLQAYYGQQIRKMGYNLQTNEDGTYSIVQDTTTWDYVSTELEGVVDYAVASVATGGIFNIVSAGVDVITKAVADIASIMNLENFKTDIYNSVVDAYTEALFYEYETNSAVKSARTTIQDIASKHLQIISDQMGDSQRKSAFEFSDDDIDNTKKQIIGALGAVLPQIVEIAGINAKNDVTEASNNISSFLSNILAVWKKQVTDNEENFELTNSLFGKNYFNIITTQILESFPEVINTLVTVSGQSANINSSYISDFLSNVISLYTEQAIASKSVAGNDISNPFYIYHDDATILTKELLNNVVTMVHNTIPSLDLSNDGEFITDTEEFFKFILNTYVASLNNANFDVLVDGVNLQTVFESIAINIGNALPEMLGNLYDKDSNFGINTNLALSKINDFVSKYFEGLSSVGTEIGSHLATNSEALSLLDKTFAKEFGKRMASLASENAISDSVSLDNQISFILKTAYDDTEMKKAVNNVTEKLTDIEVKLAVISNKMYSNNTNSESQLTVSETKIGEMQ